MVRIAEYDFLTWTSFPSSAKTINDEPGKPTYWGRIIDDLVVKPNAKINVSFKAKQSNVLHYISGVAIDGRDGKEWKRLARPSLPYGTLEWKEYSQDFTVPSDVTIISVLPIGGAGPPETPGITWFDDLKIYQDGMLIYQNDFSKWDPVIGAGIGAGVLGVVVPAVVRVPEPGVAYEYQKPLLEKEPLWAAALAGLGALVGGGVGLLTALGLVPVPQIPPLPTLEEPQGGARLGTYVVRG